MTTGSKGPRRKLPAAAVARVPAAKALAPTHETPVKAEPAKPAPVAAKPAPVAPAPKPVVPVAGKPPVTPPKAAPAPAPKPVTPPPAVIAVAAPPPAAAAPVPEIPATPSPKPDADPVLADVAATPIPATEDIIMDVNTTIENATDKSQAVFADLTERSKGAVEKGQKLIAELNDFNKGTIEAVVESSKIAARGIETMGQDAAAYAKTSFEGASQALKTLATVKSPTEFMKLQADYARSAFDAMMAHTSRSTEASLKLAGEVAQPISNRIAIAAEKIKITA